MPSQAAVACNYFTVHTSLLCRFCVLFFIEVTTREVFFAGGTTNPTGAWTTQTARHLFLRHADQFIDAFDEIFRAERSKILKTPHAET